MVNSPLVSGAPSSTFFSSGDGMGAPAVGASGVSGVHLPSVEAGLAAGGAASASLRDSTPSELPGAAAATRFRCRAPGGSECVLAVHPEGDLTFSFVGCGSSSCSRCSVASLLPCRSRSRFPTRVPEVELLGAELTPSGKLVVLQVPIGEEGAQRAAAVGKRYARDGSVLKDPRRVDADADAGAGAGDGAAASSLEGSLRGGVASRKGSLQDALDLSRTSSKLLLARSSKLPPERPLVRQGCAPPGDDCPAAEEHDLDEPPPPCEGASAVVRRLAPLVVLEILGGWPTPDEDGSGGPSGAAAGSGPGLGPGSGLDADADAARVAASPVPPSPPAPVPRRVLDASASSIALRCVREAATRTGLRRVLAVINPISGRGLAPKTWKTQVAPLLDAAGIRHESVVTTRAGHAEELARELDLSRYDALAAVGGDGTAHEIFQGLLSRPDWRSARRIPLLQVPIGSGNALGANAGVRSVDVAALALAKGRTVHMDLASVWLGAVAEEKRRAAAQAGAGGAGGAGTSAAEANANANALSMAAAALPEHAAAAAAGAPGGPGPIGGASHRFGSQAERRFAFLSLTYGMIPALDVGTEHLRWMGNIRFTLGALWQILLLRNYEVEVAVLPAFPDEEDLEAADGEGLIERQPSQHPPVPPLPRSTSSPRTTRLPGPGMRSVDTSQPFPRSAADLPPPWRHLASTTVEMFAACNLAWLDSTFHLAPASTFDDGLSSLIWSTQSTRLRGLRVMVAAEAGKHLRLVDWERVAAVAVFPKTKEGTWIVIDGEAVPFGPAIWETHRGLCNVVVGMP